MAIKATLTADEHGKLDAALKALYTQQGDLFVLDAEGIDTHPAARGLRTALDAERNNSAKAARELKELKDKLGDLSPEDAVAARKRIQEIEDAQRTGDIPEKFKKQFDDAVNARVEKMQRDFETQKNGFETKITELNDKLKAANGTLETLTIDGAVREAASKMGLHDWAVEDAVMHARTIYHLQDGKPVPMKGDQIVYSGKKPSEPLPIGEWLESKAQEKPGWLKPNGGGGAGGDRRVGGGGSQFTLTREQARDPKVYNSTKEAARKAGQELVVVDA